MLYVLLALNRQRRRIVDFKIDQALDLIAFGVSWNCLLPVLIDAADEVIRNTDVKSYVATARQDVDVELVLIAILQREVVLRSLGVCTLLVEITGTSPVMTACYWVAPRLDRNRAAKCRVETPDVTHRPEKVP